MSGPDRAAAASEASAVSAKFVYVGGYTPRTEGTPDASGASGGRAGIRLYRLDEVDGGLIQVAAFRPPEDAPDASFLAFHPSGRFLYAVHELAEFDGRPQGAISAYAVDPSTGALALLNRVGSGGAHPCHFAVDPSGRTALAANYTGGSVAAFPIGPDGRLGPAAAVKVHAMGPAGNGSDPDRQGGPHAHCILPDPTGAWAVAADLGADRLFLYALGGQGKSGSPGGPDLFEPAGSVALPPGRGPRHVAFHPSGKVLYCVGELEPVLSAFSFDQVTGKLLHEGDFPLRPPGTDGRTYPSEVKVHPSGGFLHVGLRGAGDGAFDGFAAFTLDAAGRPAPAGHFPAGRSFPRHFAYDPQGRHLLAACQKGDSLAVFRVEAGGALRSLGSPVPTASPACVIFAPAG